MAGVLVRANSVTQVALINLASRDLLLTMFVHRALLLNVIKVSADVFVTIVCQQQPTILVDGVVHYQPFVQQIKQLPLKKHTMLALENSKPRVVWNHKLSIFTNKFKVFKH